MLYSGPNLIERIKQERIDLKMQIIKIGDLSFKELGMITCLPVGSLIFFTYYFSAHFDFEISLFWRYTEFVIFTCRYNTLHSSVFNCQVSVSIYVYAIFSFPSYMCLDIEQIGRDSLLLKITQIWVIAICVVYDNNTVILQKEKLGGGGRLTYKKSLVCKTDSQGRQIYTWHWIDVL